MNNKELEERINDYKEIIIYSTDMSEHLGIDELLLLLSECIGDKGIEEEVGKYVDEYYKDFEQIQKEFIELHKEIDELREKLSKYEASL